MRGSGGFTTDDAPARARRLRQQTVGQRSVPRHVGRARVEIRTTEVVVREPGVGPEHQQHAPRSARRRMQHEEREVRAVGRRASARPAVDRFERDLVEARRPIRLGRDLDGDRPTTAFRDGIVGHPMFVDEDMLESRDRLAAPHRRASRSRVPHPTTTRHKVGSRHRRCPNAASNTRRAPRYEPLPYGRVMISSRCPSGSGK